MSKGSKKARMTHRDLVGSWEDFERAWWLLWGPYSDLLDYEDPIEDIDEAEESWILDYGMRQSLGWHMNMPASGHRPARSRFIKEYLDRELEESNLVGRH